MAEPVTAEVTEAADLTALSVAAADFVAAVVTASVAEGGRCTVALSGGSTPRRLYELLAGAYRDRAPWSRVEWFFGDERCVPPDHPESNYRSARESLFVPLRIAPGLVHRIPGERLPADAAAAYDAVLHDRLTAGRFDLVLLGLGADGHTASLFPGAPALDERERWAISVDGGAELAVRERVTVTLPVLNAARVVSFLAAGTEKRSAVSRVLAGDTSLPAGRVHPAGRLVWFVDQAARGN